MKKKNAFWTLLLAVFVGTGLVACSDDDDDKESIVPELIPAEDSKAFFEEGISFTYHGGEVMVVFAANTHWEVKAVQEDGEEATWCEFVGTGWGGKGQMNNFLRNYPF